MPRLVTFIDEKTLNNLKELAEKTSKPLSNIAAELIGLGCKVKLLQDNQKPSTQAEKRAELEARHTEFFVRILAISSDILRCIRNERSGYNDENTDDVLNLIKAQTQKYIAEYVGEGQ